MPSWDAPPGTERPRRFRPKLRYELLGCGLHGHELLGTDARMLRPGDEVFAREWEGLRWYRCLRCDSWLPLEPPRSPTVDVPPDPATVEVPLRGRPLRDRFVLRAIALDRVVHIVVLSALAVAIFVFAQHRTGLHHDYTRVLADLQGGLGGPVNNGASHSGVVGELNRLFALSTGRLYLIGTGVVVYTAVLTVEAVGLWWAKRWAEYLTLVETAVLIPLEIHELIATVTVLKVVTLVLNLAVVVYLLVAHRLFGLRGGGAAERAEKERDTGWTALERAMPRSLPDAG